MQAALYLAEGADAVKLTSDYYVDHFDCNRKECMKGWVGKQECSEIPIGRQKTAKTRIGYLNSYDMHMKKYRRYVSIARQKTLLRRRREVNEIIKMYSREEYKPLYELKLMENEDFDIV